MFSLEAQTESLLDISDLNDVYSTDSTVVCVCVNAKRLSVAGSANNSGFIILRMGDHNHETKTRLHVKPRKTEQKGKTNGDLAPLSPD